eukprot:3901571-Amphidinium_carterae.1
MEHKAQGCRWRGPSYAIDQHHGNMHQVLNYLQVDNTTRDLPSLYHDRIGYSYHGKDRPLAFRTTKGC